MFDGENIFIGSLPCWILKLRTFLYFCMSVNVIFIPGLIHCVLQYFQKYHCKVKISLFYIQNFKLFKIILFLLHFPDNIRETPYFEYIYTDVLTTMISLRIVPVIKDGNG